MLITSFPGHRRSAWIESLQAQLNTREACNLVNCGDAPWCVTIYKRHVMQGPTSTQAAPIAKSLKKYEITECWCMKISLENKAYDNYFHWSDPSEITVSDHSRTERTCSQFSTSLQLVAFLWTRWTHAATAVIPSMSTPGSAPPGN